MGKKRSAGITLIDFSRRDRLVAFAIQQFANLMRPFGLAANRTYWEMTAPAPVSLLETKASGARVVETGDLPMNIRNSVAFVTGAPKNITRDPAGKSVSLPHARSFIAQD
jgi:hypothetical protein